MFENYSNILFRNIIILFPIIWSFGPAIQDILITIIAIFFVISSLKNKDYNFLNDRLSLVLICFFSSIIFSSIFSINPENSLIKSSAYIRYLLFFFAINYLLNFNRNDFKKFFIINIIFLIFLSLDIFYQAYLGVDIFGLRSGMDGMRNSGFFGDEWIAGSFTVKVFFLTIIFFLIFKIKKFYFYSFYVLIFITIFLTGERMSLILFGLGSLIFFFLYKDFIKYKIYGIFILIISFLLIISFNPNARYRIIDQTFYQLIYGQSNKYHKYFNVEIFNIYPSDQIEIRRENNFLINKSPIILATDNLLNFANYMNEHDKFELTRLAWDSWILANKYYERIDLQIEYQRGENIEKIKNRIDDHITKYQFKNLDNLKIQIFLPKKFELKKNRPIVDTGWGAHFLAAINIWLDKPLFGHGIKTFRELCSYEKYKTISKMDEFRCSTHPHNFYFELLAETGIVSLIFLIFAFLIILKKSNIIKNKYSGFYFIILVLIIWPLGTTGSFFNNHNAGIFWFIISLSYYTFRNKKLLFKLND